MSKEILLYGGIDSYSSSAFIKALDEAKDDDVTVRVNTTGGSPEYGWGMVAKFAEHKGKKYLKGDGQAHSMGMFYFCYADDSECLDVTEFLVHRAAYAEWYESNPNYFTDAVKGNLERTNKNLRAAFENKVDVAKFEELKGVKVKDIFSMENRIDVFLTAAEAKKIGLVNKVTKITPEKRAEIDSVMFDITAKASGYKKAAEITPIKETTIKNTTMTLEKLKAEHPAIFAEAVALGVAQEKDRVEACLTFIEIDAAGVKAAIESGKPLSQKQMADFSLKAISASTLKKIENESTTEVKTKEVEAVKTEAEKKLAAFEAEVDALKK